MMHVNSFISVVWIKEYAKLVPNIFMFFLLQSLIIIIRGVILTFQWWFILAISAVCKGLSGDCFLILVYIFRVFMAVCSGNMEQSGTFWAYE